MRYMQIRNYDVANGPGIRSTLFVAGCTLRCPSCFNHAYQDFKAGEPWTADVEEAFIEHIKQPKIKGVTILGGEPLDQIMDDQLYNLLKRIKEETKKNIWIFSGHLYEDLIQHPRKRAILSCCDVLVDGPFILEQKDLKLKFRGSANQRLIDLPKTFEAGTVQLLELD